MKERGSRYNIEQLQEAVQKSECFSDVCRFLNVTVCGFNYDKIKNHCRENNICVSHFDVKRTFRRNKIVHTLEDLISGKVSRGQLRYVLIRLGHFTGKCGECGISEWNNKPLTIELDHINGINDDNRLENLRWLCPNCHSQTETFKNSKARRKRLISTE